MKFGELETGQTFIEPNWPIKEAGPAPLLIKLPGKLAIDTKVTTITAISIGPRGGAPGKGCVAIGDDAEVIPVRIG